MTEAGAEPNARTKRVLLIEDDGEVALTICNGLGVDGFSVEPASSLTAGKQLLASKQYDAVVLDLTLPDGDGLEFALELRTSGIDVPVLMLTGRDSVRDRLVGFEHGADDYLGKPFDVDELAARLRAILRRSFLGERHVLRYAGLELDLLSRTVRRGRLKVTLSDRETALLAFLLRHADEILTRQRILEEVWGDDVYEDSNVLNVYISFLRNKTETAVQGRLIHSVRGVGYLLAEKDPDEVTWSPGGLSLNVSLRSRTSASS